MTHKQKSQILQLLEKLPDSLGNFIYHQLQKRSDGSNVEKKIKSTTNSYNLASRILIENEVVLKDKTVVEIGSGWVPIFPYLLILEGEVKAVKTYDINEHFSKAQIEVVNEYFANFNNFTIEPNQKYNLLKNITYYANENVINADVKNVDFIFSRFVLEHIPTDLLIEMHSQFAAKLKKGSHILHLISPSDHRAYTDSSLSLQDFLQYSQEEWNNIQTRFDYHNRLRLPQYLEILSKDFEIVSVEHDQINFDSASYKNFKQLKVHSDFEKYSDQELMAGSINVLLRKK